MSKFKSIVSAVYSYTHIFVGAGAVVTSFLDTQALPPKWAAGVIIASQALKVANDWLAKAKGVSPLAEKVVEAAVTQVEKVTHPAEPVPTAPLEPATPAAPANVAQVV